MQHIPRYQAKHPFNTGKILIKDGSYIATCNEQDEVTVQRAQSIYIEDGIIQSIMPAGQEGKLVDQADVIYDAGLRGGIVITPGLINTHSHPPMYLLRSTTLLSNEYATTEESLEVARQIERSMNLEDQTIAALGDFTEQQKMGTTTIVSHYHTAQATAEAAQQAHVRLINAVSMASKTDPSANIASAEAAVQYSGGLITPGFTIHTLESVSREDLQQAKQLLEKYPAAILTIHCGETDTEVNAAKERHGKLPIEVLHEAGLLGPRLLLSHAVHLTDAEITLLAKYKVGIAHLPTSNRIHKSGKFKYSSFWEAGAAPRIGLGTDSVISKSRLDIVSEAFQSKVMHQNSEHPVSYETLFQMMTSNGARVVHMEGKIGKILPGYQADLAFWKLKDRMFVPYNSDDPKTLIGNLITHAGYTVRDLMIKGKFVIQERRHELVNESELLVELQNRHNHLRQRIKS